MEDYGLFPFFLRKKSIIKTQQIKMYALILFVKQKNSFPFYLESPVLHNMIT